MATIAVTNHPVTNDAGIIFKSSEQLYLKDLVAIQSAPTSIADTASNLAGYQWIIFGVAITTSVSNPSYTIQVFYWDDALKDFVAGVEDTGDGNKLFVFKTYGRKVAARITAMQNITSLSVSAGGWNGEE